MGPHCPTRVAKAKRRSEDGAIVRLSALLVLSLVIPLSGCEGMQCKNAHAPFTTDCSYGAGPVTASTRFTDETWNATLVAGALDAMGLTRQPSAYTVVVGAKADLQVIATLAENGTTQLDLQFQGPSGIGYTREEAEALNNATQAANTARALGMLASFENVTGWRHDTEVVWTRALLVV